jgi:hypothetical protein
MQLAPATRLASLTMINGLARAARLTIFSRLDILEKKSFDFKTCANP